MSYDNFINVSAAFFPNNRKVLVAQRNETSNDPLKWEFPGGKLLDDEAFDDALIREFKEEFGADIKVIEEVGSTEIENDKGIFILMFLLIETAPAKIKQKIHKEIKYVNYSELKALDLCEADRIFIENYEKDIRKFID